MLPLPVPDRGKEPDEEKDLEDILQEAEALKKRLEERLKQVEAEAAALKVEIEGLRRICLATATFLSGSSQAFEAIMPAPILEERGRI